MKRVHVFISGRVQGVTFRYTTRKKAKKLGVKGYVRNTEDGKVEVVAEGKRESVEKLLEFCRKGPMLAKVREVKVDEETPTGELDSFDIRH